MWPRTKEPEWPPLPPTRFPDPSISDYTGQLIRDMQPRRTLRERLRALLRRAPTA